MTEPAVTADDAVSRLETTFGAIRRDRMQDVPILNPALQVEAIGMRAWQGHWLGALVTPWFINLVLLPGQGAWRSVADRDSVWHGCDLLSVGVSSFGHLSGVHYQNDAGWDGYLQAVEGGRFPLSRAFVPTASERLTRELILQLKLGRVDTRG